MQIMKKSPGYFFRCSGSSLLREIRHPGTSLAEDKANYRHMIENTNDQELIKIALLEFFPDECSIAGDATVSKIATGHVEVVRTKGGSNFDIMPVISILVSGASLISSIIAIRKDTRKEKKTPPGKTTVNIQNINIGQPEIAESLKAAIGKYIESELDKRHHKK